MIEEKIPSNFQDEMYNIRVLFFIEKYSFTNEYYQIRLTEDQYKKTLAFLEGFFPHTDSGEFAVNTNDEIYTLPDLKSDYEET